MTALYLVAASQQAMLDALAQAGLLLPDGTPQEVSHRHCLVVLGELAGVGGWHANLRYWSDFDHAPLALITIPTPVTPAVVWA